MTLDRIQAFEGVLRELVDAVDTKDPDLSEETARYCCSSSECPSFGVALNQERFAVAEAMRCARELLGETK